MIAQNDFEKLVLEDSKERSEILRKLLRTEKIEQFQKNLKDRTNTLAKDEKAQANTLRDTVAGFVWDETAQNAETVQLYLEHMKDNTFVIHEQLMS